MSPIPKGVFKSIWVYMIKCSKAWWAAGLRLGFPQERSKLALCLSTKVVQGLPLVVQEGVFFNLVSRTVLTHRPCDSASLERSFSTNAPKIVCEKGFSLGFPASFSQFSCHSSLGRRSFNVRLSRVDKKFFRICHLLREGVS